MTDFDSFYISKLYIYLMQDTNGYLIYNAFLMESGAAGLRSCRVGILPLCRFAPVHTRMVRMLREAPDMNLTTLPLRPRSHPLHDDFTGRTRTQNGR